MVAHVGTSVHRFNVWLSSAPVCSGFSLIQTQLSLAQIFFYFVLDDYCTMVSLRLVCCGSVSWQYTHALTYWPNVGPFGPSLPQPPSLTSLRKLQYTSARNLSVVVHALMCLPNVGPFGPSLPQPPNLTSLRKLQYTSAHTNVTHASIVVHAT